MTVQTSARLRILAQLHAAGLLPFILERRPDGNAWRGVIATNVALPYLRADQRFEEGCLYWLHTDVGTHLTEFRSRRGALGPGSMQIVLETGRPRGAFYCDLDRFCAYQGVAPAFAHFFGEVIPGWLGLKESGDV